MPRPENWLVTVTAFLQVQAVQRIVAGALRDVEEGHRGTEMGAESWPPRTATLGLLRSG